MPTAKERTLELTSLAPGATAREHFLSIICSGSGLVFVAEGIEAELATLDGVAELTVRSADATLEGVAGEADAPTIDPASNVAGLTATDC